MQGQDHKTMNPARTDSYKGKMMDAGPTQRSQGLDFLHFVKTSTTNYYFYKSQIYSYVFFLVNYSALID